MTEKQKPREKGTDKAPEKPKLTVEEHKLLSGHKKLQAQIKAAESARNMFEEIISTLRAKQDEESKNRLVAARKGSAEKVTIIENLKKRLEEIRDSFNDNGRRNIDDYLQEKPKATAVKSPEKTDKDSEKKSAWNWQKVQAEMDTQRGSIKKTVKDIVAALPTTDLESKNKLLDIDKKITDRYAKAKSDQEKKQSGIEVQNFFELLNKLKSISTDATKLAAAVKKIDTNKSITDNLNLVNAILANKTPIAANNGKQPAKNSAEKQKEKEKLDPKGIKNTSMLMLGILIKKIPGLNDMLRNIYLSLTGGGIGGEGQRMIESLLTGIFGKGQLNTIKRWLHLTPGQIREQNEEENKKEKAREKLMKDVSAKKGFNYRVVAILAKSGLIKLGFTLIQGNKGQDLSKAQIESLAAQIGKKNANLATFIRGNGPEINKLLRNMYQKYPQLSSTRKAYLAQHPNIAGSIYFESFFSPETDKEKSERERKKPQGTKSAKNETKPIPEKKDETNKKNPPNSPLGVGVANFFKQPFDENAYFKLLEKQGIRINEKTFIKNAAGKITSISIKGGIKTDKITSNYQININNPDSASLMTKLEASTQALIRTNYFATQITEIFKNGNIFNHARKEFRDILPGRSATFNKALNGVLAMFKNIAHIETVFSASNNEVSGKIIFKDSNNKFVSAEVKHNKEGVSLYLDKKKMLILPRHKYTDLI